MSVNAQTSTSPNRAAHKPLSTPNGTLFEFLAPPEEVGDGICLIRGTVPPGVAVPLHSHPDLEPRLVLWRKGEKARLCASLFERSKQSEECRISASY